MKPNKNTVEWRLSLSVQFCTAVVIFSSIFVDMWTTKHIISTLSLVCYTNHKQCVLKVQPTRCDISQFIYSCKTLYMFQTGFQFIIRSSKLHIQRQVFVRPLLLPAAITLDPWRGITSNLVSLSSQTACIFLFFCSLFISNQKKIQSISKCDDYTKYSTIPCIAMMWQGIHPAMSPYVFCRSKGQQPFSLQMFIGCSTGSNIGLG